MSTTAAPPSANIADTPAKVKAYDNLQAFLDKWDVNYQSEVNKIDLFNTNLTRTLSKEKISYFIRAFYHVRAHFYDFFWYLGNHAPNADTKKIIVDNIAEEFGGSYTSHEQLYYNFAESFGVDIKNEFIDCSQYEQYIVRYNKGHLKWLNEHDWSSCLAAFAAFERLDNVDYTALSLLAKSFGASEKSRLFFKIHEEVKHFEPLIDLLVEIWEKTPEKIRDGFHFIGSHQMSMWKNLSDRVFDN